MVTFNSFSVADIRLYFHVGVTPSDGVARWGPHPRTTLVTSLGEREEGSRGKGGIAGGRGIGGREKGIDVGRGIGG